MATPVDPQPDLVEQTSIAQSEVSQAQSIQPRRFLRWQTLVLIGAGLVLLLGGAAAGYALGQGQRSGEPGAITASGKVHLRAGFRVNDDGTSTLCYGSGSYKDIHAGTQVTVTDPGGKVIAVGALGEGVVTRGVVGQPTDCAFPFKIEKVPAGHGIYGFEVAHRGVLRFTEADVRSKELEFVLR